MKRFMVFDVCFDNRIDIQENFWPKPIDTTEKTVYNQVKRLTYMGG